MSEARKQPRYSLTDIVEYLPENTGTAVVREEYANGVTINVSRAGLCIYTFSPLQDNQIIRLKGGTLPVPGTLAIVKWIKNIHNDFFMAGLMFI